MAMEINGNYSSYAAQSMAESSVANSKKNKETEKASETAGNSKTTGSGKSESRANYVNELAKLVPSVEFKVGSSYATAKNGKTLTINPKLLEEMQNDPEKEREMKELIKGVESMTRLSESLNKASGWKTVFRHSYIDENGQYRHFALIVNEHGYKMSEKLREERRKNSEKLIERQREKAAEKRKELQEANREKRLEKKEAEKVEESAAQNKAEQLLEEKITASEDGMVYMNDTEFKTIIEAIKEDNAGSTNTNEQPQVGANVDLQV